MSEQTTEMTREKLLRIAHIIGPSSAAAAALADMDRIEAEGDYALCVRESSRFVVIRVQPVSGWPSARARTKR